MTSNQKLLLIALGVFALFLLVSQFALGQLLLTAGGDMRNSLLKAHKHLGHTMFAVTLAYLFLSLWRVINTPTLPRSKS